MRLARVAAVVLPLLLLACKTAQKPGEKPGLPAVVTTVAPLDVPHVSGPIKIDGELDEADWKRAARTGAFVDRAMAEARPNSDARFLWDDDALFVALYAADQDIEAKVKEHDSPLWLEDSFSIRVVPEGSTSHYLIDVSAAGVISDARELASGALDPKWESGMTAKVDIDEDETLNDPSDEDEEWVVEARIPLASIGVRAGERVGLRIGRCDTPKGGTKACGAWGERGGAVEGAIRLVR